MLFIQRIYCHNKFTLLFSSLTDCRACGFFLRGFSALFSYCTGFFLVHGTCLSLFDGSLLRLPRQQLNPVSFWLFFQICLTYCKSSSSDLIIRFVVFMLTTTEYWRQINSEHCLAVEQRNPMEWLQWLPHREREPCRCDRLGRSLLRFCLNKSVSDGHSGRWQRESLGALPCSRWPGPKPLGQIQQLPVASYSRQRQSEPIKHTRHIAVMSRSRYFLKCFSH